MRRALSGVALAVVALSCSTKSPPAPRDTAGASSVALPATAAPHDGRTAPSDAAAAAAPDAAPAAPPAPAQIDPDGNDDPETPGDGKIPARAHFEKVGLAPLALLRICDLTPLGDALYAAHANNPLGSDGATITRYRPNDDHPFTVAFDWNRPGEPTKGGGGGQGFVRVHRIGERLFVPDADPPYNGFGISEPGTEGFVFVSGPDGTFARARMPGHQPPRPPDAAGKAGAAVLPRAYHVIDAIRFRGRYYASTGSVPPTERAWRGASPGALHVANADLSRWQYEVDYPYPWKDGVWRLTFMVRFRDRLYAGIQDYDGREPNDYVTFSPPKDSARIERADLKAVRVTARGTAQTIRWYTDRGALYWIAWSHRDGTWLRRTLDGDNWEVIYLPDGVGAPTDIVRFRDALVVLTERALVRIDGERPTVVATITDKKTPFELSDTFCAAPLAVFANDLYAGGQRRGALFKLVADN
jgi:hypothetical protein